MNKDLTYWGNFYGTDKATYHGFTTFYESIFKESNYNPKSILEIGVKDGASLNMWASYFPKATWIAGWDINTPEGYTPVDSRIHVYNINATDTLRVNKFISGTRLDLVVDDGSHNTADQIKTFKLLWHKVRIGGIYIIEDLHTSFIDSYINSPKTTYEWLQEQTDLDFTIYQKDPNSQTDSMTVVIFKR